MTEKAQLTTYLNGISPVTKKPYSDNTKKSYFRFYDKLRSCLGKDIVDSSQDKIVTCSNDETSTNSKQGILNIGLIIRNINKMKTDKIVDARDKNKGKIIEDVKEKNTHLDLPSYADLEDFVEYLWDNNKWTDYIINYLLLNFQVRNQDVNFTIVKRKKDATNPDLNYIWLAPKKAVYFRRNYKTSGTYGDKKNTITDTKFLTALRRIKARGDVFIPNDDQVGYYVKKSTFKEIGEGAYMKIIVNHFRGNLQKLREIAQNRGTKLETITTNYDIDLN